MNVPFYVLVHVSSNLLVVTGLVAYLQSIIFGKYLIDSKISNIWRAAIYSIASTACGIYWFAKQGISTSTLHGQTNIVEILSDLESKPAELLIALTVTLYLFTLIITFTAVSIEKIKLRIPAIILVWLSVNMISFMLSK